MQFIQGGFERLHGLLSALHEQLDGPHLGEFLRSAGELLRLLAGVMLPYRTQGTVVRLDGENQRSFAEEIRTHLENITSMLTDPDLRVEESLPRMSEYLALLLRLAQFHLTFWKSSPSDVQSSLATSIRLFVNLLMVRRTCF